MTEQTDPEAPYGRYTSGAKAGQPRERPVRSGRRRAASGKARGGAGPAAPPRRPAPSGPTATRAPTGRIKAREDAAAGGFQMLMMPLALVPDRRVQLSVYATTKHVPGIARGAAVTAERVPQLAALLDRIGQVGPYAALVNSLIPWAATLATIWGAPYEATQLLGAESVAQLEAEMAGAAAEAAAQLRQLRAEQAAAAGAGQLPDDLGDVLDAVERDAAEQLAGV